VLLSLEAERVAASHAARLRKLGPLTLRLLAGGIALLLAGGLVSLALVRMLDDSVKPWLAALVVGAGWLLLATVLSLPVLARLRRLLSSDLSLGRDAAELASAESEVRAGSEALLEVLAVRFARQEEQRLERAAEHELARVENGFQEVAAMIEDEAGELESETASALGELVEVVSLPARAGLNALRRLIG